MSDHFITTDSGRRIDFVDLDPNEITIEDIARNLSNYCRFGGGVRTFYSVAEHSIRVAGLCTPDKQLHGLLHDAAEAYLGDVVAPLKHMPGMEFYRELERYFDGVILPKFGCDTEMPRDVEIADKRLRRTEQRDIRTVQPAVRSTSGIEPLKERIEPLEAESARLLFMRVFGHLTKMDGNYIQVVDSDRDADPGAPLWARVRYVTWSEHRAPRMP